MTPGLEARWKGEFPAFFREMGGSPRETCMGRGCECGDGWFALIRNLCLELRDYLDGRPDLDFRFTQVKEKFGLPRIYSEGVDDRTKALIEGARGASTGVCERRGGQDAANPDHRSTLCPACQNVDLRGLRQR